MRLLAGGSGAARKTRGRLDQQDRLSWSVEEVRARAGHRTASAWHSGITSPGPAPGCRRGDGGQRPQGLGPGNQPLDEPDPLAAELGAEPRQQARHRTGRHPSGPRRRQPDAAGQTASRTKLDVPPGSAPQRARRTPRPGRWPRPPARAGPVPVAWPPRGRRPSPRDSADDGQRGGHQPPVSAPWAASALMVSRWRRRSRAVGCSQRPPADEGDGSNGGRDPRDLPHGRSIGLKRRCHVAR